MSREIIQTGFVEHQFDFYVSETNKVIVWIHNGICTAAFIQSGDVCAMIKPFFVKEEDSIIHIAHSVAMDLIVNYFDEGVSDQIIQQINK